MLEVRAALLVGLSWCGTAQVSAATPAPDPTVAGIAYASATPGEVRLLDLYLPSQSKARIPVVLWTRGSAWMASNGREGAGWLAEQLLPNGIAVVGVSIRSSGQAPFPAQLHDIKAAIRWVRANADKYQFAGDQVGIVGDSSGGWTSAMAAMTGDLPELEGNVGITGFSSKVQAAVAFYPPTDFSRMDSWSLKPCDPKARLGTPGSGSFCHDSVDSPESRLVGCAIQTCPDKVRAANPIRYISDQSPPIMILHGQSDPFVPHNQGERLYLALMHACRDAEFISLPYAGHGPPQALLSSDAARADATRRWTKAAGCMVSGPAPVSPTFDTLVAFLKAHLQ
jgi:acetyl esterase/lipase